MTIPAASEYPPFFAGYVGLVPETDIVSVLSSQVDLVPRLSEAVGADRELYAYEPSKLRRRAQSMTAAMKGLA